VGSATAKPVAISNADLFKINQGVSTRKNEDKNTDKTKAIVLLLWKEKHLASQCQKNVIVLVEHMFKADYTIWSCNLQVIIDQFIILEYLKIENLKKTE